MKRMKMLLGAAITAALCTSAASAATTVIAVGSSAIWQTAALGAYSIAGSGKAHYTIKGACGTVNCAQVIDKRGDAHIVPQGGNLWVVWDSQGDVWADLSVDSVVGNRSFLSAPRAQLQVSSEVESTKAGQALISSSLWGADAAAIPSTVYAKLNAALTAAFSDIRPEDALFAETRTVTPTTTKGGLGYGSSDPNVGVEIKSTYSSAEAQPVNFNLSLRPDPITKQTVPASTTIPVGASPIIFFANHGGAALPSSLTITQIDDAFSACAVINGVDLTTVVREPISGTMNTTEFTTFLNSTGPRLSQEHSVSPSDNPLNLGCANGTARTRAIGTGDLVSAVQGRAKSIGYAFFGYGNFSKIANNPNYTYFQVNGVDPIHASYTNGELPACTAPCKATPGSTFPNLRNGKYNAWSVLRAVTDASGANFTNTTNLVNAIQANINNSVPDFVPFKAVGGDPGLHLYRSHYTQSGVSPNNGLSGQTETGGDMGGCVETRGSAPGVLNCKDFSYPPG